MKKIPVEKLPAWIQKLHNADAVTVMQIKFVATAMGILILVFLIMLGAINLIMQTVSQSQSMELLQQIAESERYDSLTSDAEPQDELLADEMNMTFQDEMDGMIAQLADTIPEQNNNNNNNGDNKPPETKQALQSPAETMPLETGQATPPTKEDMPADTQENSPPGKNEQAEKDDNTPLPAETTAPETEKIQKKTELTESTREITMTETKIASESQDSETYPSESVKESKSSKPSDTKQQEEESHTQEKQPDNSYDPSQKLEPVPNKWTVNISLEHFALMADADGNFLGIRNTENYTMEQAAKITEVILTTKKTQGMYGWLQYYETEKEYGTLIVVTDKTSDQGLLNNLFRTTIVIGIIMLLLLFVFLVFWSRWITAPVQAAMDRQKQFISDASHELKTPLAVLTANADILQDEIGENKWLGYMCEQTERMNQLVSDLLRLARMDSNVQDYVFEEFDLSTAIEATALPFESTAFELQKNLEMDIQPNLTYYGSQQHIRQLAVIFIDNAMKYSNAYGTIKITLFQRGDNKILEFYNTGCEISQAESKKIFERFYRGDKARNNKGKNGYGLGLAIAKSIMEIHKIKIQVTCEQDAWIRFLLIL